MSTTDARSRAIAQPNQLAKQQATEYRRQLLRIVDQIERDYLLGKYANAVPCDCGKCEPEIPFDTPLGAVDLKDSQAVAAQRFRHIDTHPK